MPGIPLQTPPGPPGARARRLSTALAAAAGLGLALAACRGDATGPAAHAVRLQLAEPGPDTVVAGSTTRASVRVRAVDGDGDPVEGLEVRFTVLRGGGSVSPPTDATDAAGEAGAVYRPGESPGTATLRIDAPRASDVAPLIRSIVQRPSRRLELVPAGGDGQEAEAGSQLPLPFRVRVRDGDGDPAAGERVEWSLTDAPDGARLEPLSARTDSAGEAAALLTLGDSPGTHRVRVHGTGSVASDTARFTARGVTSLGSGLRVDSVTPLPLEPGGEATVHGSGFPASGAEVRVDGRPATLLQATEGRIRIRLPVPDGCRPDRLAGVRVMAGDALSNGLMVPLEGTGSRTDLAPGEIRTLGPEDARCIRLPARADARSLRIVLQSTARSGAGELALELSTRVGSGGSASAAATVVAAAASPTPDRVRQPAVEPDRAAGPRAAGAAPVLRLQARARRELTARGARPADRGAGERAPPVAATPPADIGDLLELHFAVGRDLSVSCADTTGGVTARVRARRSSVILAEDTAAGAGFTDQEHQLLAGEFEELVFPTDTAYFGAPSDLDGNGRVILLFTHRVNELTPRDAEAAVGGFFLPLDLAESGDGDEGGVPGPGGETCPASNEAEVLYLPVPDPAGLHGPEFSRAEALRNARGIVAHELMHLLSAGQRVVMSDRGFLALEEVWLAEALSHLAEEVVGFRFLDMEPGRRLDFGDFAGTRQGIDAFNTFHLQNFGRLQLYLLDPAAAPVLSLTDPGGVPSLQMRGFGWLLVRWLADRFASPEEEAAFVRTLSVGGPARLAGIENVEAATGTDWGALLEDFALVPLLEGTDMTASPPASASRREAAELATWALAETYRGLAENPGSRSLFPLGYPLIPPRLAFSDGLRPLALRPGASVYLSLGSSTASPPLALALRDGAGGPLSDGAALRLTLVRVR